MREAPPDNLFGRILAGSVSSHEVFQDEHTYCFLDIFPQAPGHTLVIPRNFSPNVEEADTADIQYCLAAVRRLIPVIKQVTGAKGVTVLTNSGREAGQLIDYLHFHILPRSPQDAISLSNPGEPVDDESLAKMAGRIKALLG